MRRAALLLFIMIIGCTCAAYQERTPRYLDWVEHQRQSTLALLVQCTKGNAHWITMGSAVAISPRHLLTAEHVVDCDGGDPLAIMGMDRDGKTHELLVSKLGGADLDVARLVVEGSGEPFRAWGEFGPGPKLGQVVCVVHARPRRGRKCGEVSEWRTGSGWAGAGSFEYEARTIGGTSGSGVWLRNHLVGIHVGGSHGEGADHFSVGVHWGQFKDLLVTVYLEGPWD